MGLAQVFEEMGQIVCEVWLEGKLKVGDSWLSEVHFKCWTGVLSKSLASACSLSCPSIQGDSCHTVGPLWIFVG